MLDWDSITGIKKDDEEKTNHSKIDWDSIMGTKSNKQQNNISTTTTKTYSNSETKLPSKYDGMTEQEILAERRKLIIKPVKKVATQNELSKTQTTVKEKQDNTNMLLNAARNGINASKNINTATRGTITNNVAEQQKQVAQRLYEARKVSGQEKEKQEAEYVKQYQEAFNKIKSDFDKSANKVSAEKTTAKKELPKLERVVSSEEADKSKEYNTFNKTVDNAKALAGNVGVGILSTIPSAMEYADSVSKAGVSKTVSKALGLPEGVVSVITDPLTSKLTKINKHDLDDFKKWRDNTTVSNINKTNNKATRKLAELAPSIGNNLVPAAVTAINPVAGSVLFMTSAAGNYLEDAERRGMNKDQALAYSTVMGLMEGGSEAVITGGFASKLKKLITGKAISKKILESYGVNLAENFLQEALIEPIQEATAHVVAGEDKANWDNMSNRMLDAGIDGVLSAIILDGVVHGTVKIDDILNKKASEKQVMEAIVATINFGKTDIKSIVDGAAEAIRQQGNTYSIPIYSENKIQDVSKVKGQPISISNNKLNRDLAIVNIDNGYVVIDADTGTRLDRVYENKFEAIENINKKINNLSNESVKSIRRQIYDTQKQIENEIEVAEAEKRADNFIENIQNATGQTEIGQNDILENEPTSYISEDIKNNSEANIEVENNYKAEAINEVQKSYISDENKTEILNTINSLDNISKDDLELIKTTVDKINEFDLSTNGNYKNDAERKQKYLKYKNDNSDYDSKTVNEVLDIIPTNRNGKRTVKQWLKVAEEIGKRIANKNNSEIENIAYKSWFELQPIKNITRYDNQTKTNQAFQKLTSDEWINTINNAVIEGRKNSILQKETEVKNNSIIDEKELLKSIENFEKATDTISRQDIINIANALNVYHKGNVYINENMMNKAGKNNKPRITSIDDYFKLFTDKEDLREQAYNYALKELKNKEVNIKDIDEYIDMAQKGLKKTFGTNQDNIKMQSANNLMDIIEEGIYLNSSNKGKNIIYHYFYAPVKTSRGKEIAMITITEDLSNNNQKNKFYYHDLREFSNLKKNLAHAMPHNKVRNMLFEQDSYINNSITQKDNSVKEKTIVNNKDMQREKNNTNIQDFGEKIGGARKDTSAPKTINTNNKEVIHDYTVSKNDNGYVVEFKKKVLKDGFSTQKEAEQYILDFKDSIKSNLAYVREGTNGQNEPVYIIMLRNPRTLKTEMTSKQFKNKQDAESYAIALSMYLKDHNKNLFRPQIQKVTRENKNIPNATKATGENILNDFGFRGGEFGNWVTQKERQEFLNYAKDAFTDLAIALEIENKDLGQNKQMAIAFGARGKGLTGAVAHFEPGKKVINMTRLKGAGSLAHEYGHSVDNWLSRLGGYAEDGMVTTNYRNPNLSENMKKAINDVKEALEYSISKDETEVARKNEIFEKNRKESLQYHMKYLDKIFDDKATKYQYNRKTKQREQITIITTEKQKKEYNRIKNILLEGQLQGEVERKTNFDNYKVETIYPKEIETIRSMFKELMGRKIDEDMLYWLNRYGRLSRQLTEIKSQSAFYKSALELDKMMGRKTTYFAKIEEMWARAFESYIYDKLKAKGITNTYLVHSVNNSDYALFNPYPAGEERQNINKAFDNLFKVMKEENKLHSNNEDIRYMKKTIKENKKVYDNKGNELTKAQQEYFKNSKLRNKKNELEIVYHSTPNLFTEFDDSKLGDNTFYSNTAFGHFVTTNKKFSERFKDIDNKGNKGYTMEMYANIEKSIIHPYNAYYKYSGNQLDDIVRNYLRAINETEALKELEENAQDEGISLYEMYMGVAINDEVYEFAKDEREILKKKGYDAVEFVEGMEKDLIEGSKSIEPVISYAIFNAEQLKMITNKNPALNKDVRYMKKGNTNTNKANQKEIIRYDKQTTDKKDTQKIDEDPKRNAERADAYIEQEIRKLEETGKWDNSIPVTKLTDIRKTLENYLGLGIKRGHFRANAYAIYKTNRDIIRTKELKDMDSILHEVGHALDTGKRLNVDKESISDELFRAISKIEGYENDTREIKLEEGFAEVLRMYAIVPEQASKEYPETIAVIKELRKNDASFNKFINKLQTQIYNYIHQNPQNRQLSNISVGEQTDKAVITKEWLKQEVVRNVWDKDYNLKVATEELAKVQGKTSNQIKASQNAYYLTRLASGIGDKITSMLADGILDEKGKQLTPGLNKVGEILGNNPQRYNDLRAYLVSERDLEYKAKTLRSGLRTSDSKAVIEKFKGDKQIHEAAKVIYDTLDGILQYSIDNHLLDEKTAKELRESNAFYVPMQRVIENQGNGIGRRGAVKDIIKKRTGSELDIKDVLENIVANSSNIIQQVENNSILKALYNEGEESRITGAIYDVIDTPMKKVGTANLQMWEKELRKQGVNTDDLDLSKTIDIFNPNNKVDAQNLITSFINDKGERIYLQFKDELIFNSVMNMDKKFMSMLLNLNRMANLPLRFGATMGNVGFAIPNMISDTLQASVYSTAGFVPVIDNAIGVVNILAQNNKQAKAFLEAINPQYAKRSELLYKMWKQTGSTSATRLSQYRDSTQKLMKEVYGTKNSQTLGIKESWKPLKRVLDLLSFIPELSEQSTRYRVFEKNYNYYTKKGFADRDALVLAALESRDATQDFGRTGNFTKEVNQVIPFSSARVGSIYTATEKVKANPKRVAFRTAILITAALIIKAMGYDDKEIEELKQRKKDDNFVMKIGDKIHTFKKPQGILRSVINLAEYIQDLTTGHIDEGKEGERLINWTTNAIMDNMPADEVTGLVPNIISPLVENAINKDLYYKNDIVKSYDLELPNKDQYYEYNSQLAILLGRAFNYSPAKIDNLISGYFAGVGTDTTRIMDYIMGKVGMIPEKAEMGIEENPVGKRFVVNVNSYSSSVDEIYNRKTELTKKKNGGTITNKESQELDTLTAAISDMSKINKQIKEIKSDLRTSGKQKAEQIRVLQQERTDIARQALGKDLINSSNKTKIESTKFYPTTNELKSNNKVLTMTKAMKAEYESIAYQKYQEYKKQGLYTEEKCISGAKNYAKKQLLSTYKNLIK